MYHINIHCKPAEENFVHFGKYLGAYAVVLTDFKNIDGAFELAKFYVSDNKRQIIEVEEACFHFEEKEQLSKRYKNTLTE